MAIKQCTRCSEWKPLDGFAPQKKGKFGRKSMCRECEYEYQREYRARKSLENIREALDECLQVGTADSVRWVLCRELETRRIRQHELAEAVGVTQNSVGSYVRGEKTPYLETAARIAEVLGMTLDQFAVFGGCANREDCASMGVSVPKECDRRCFERRER